ncbi:hypothetical protein PISL3812_08227 [Talaromyces islandicus]|uniref:Uncharacterized protein n=1 Tax=Talaromyces islandicus TaxID=28573 RepID=A0A0U1M6G6_TALIS|nr:hypothetical protein PISL3812_08227 [Talaromyces islandicus]
MALSPETIIALVTLIVTCPPSMLLLWAFLKRSHRTLFVPRPLPCRRSQSIASQISNQYNTDDPRILFDNISYRLHTHTGLLTPPYNTLAMRAHQIRSATAVPPSTIEREPTIRQWGPRNETFEGTTIVIERHSATQASLVVSAPTEEVV